MQENSKKTNSESLFMLINDLIKKFSSVAQAFFVNSSLTDLLSQTLRWSQKHFC